MSINRNFIGETIHNFIKYRYEILRELKENFSKYVGVMEFMISEFK